MVVLKKGVSLYQQKQTAMTSVKFNKIVTAVKDSSVVNFRTRNDFWNWASTQDSFSLTANTAKMQILNKLTSLGFEVELNDDWGILDSDFRLIAKK